MNHSCLSFQYNSILVFPWLRLTISVALGITSVTGVSLNSLILHSIWKNPALHKPSYLLLANLALSDTFYGAFAHTFKIFANYAYMANWTTKYCYIAAITHVLSFWLASVSLYCLTLMSIDRLLAIQLKNRYRSFVTSRRIWMLTIPFWVGSLLLMLIFLLLNVFHQYVSTVIAPSYIVLFVSVMTVCYSMAFYSLKKLSSVSPSSSQQPQHGIVNFDVSQYRRSMNTMLLVMLTTLLLYLPYSAAVVTHNSANNHGANSYFMVSYKTLMVSEAIIATNSTVNPLLYLWRLQDVRQSVKTTVKQIFRQEES